MQQAYLIEFNLVDATRLNGDGGHAPSIWSADGSAADSDSVAERNGAPVWISTFTRNLQRQIDQELDRLYPDADLKNRKVAIRKGRENYLCLLNFEDMAAAAAPLRER